MLRQTVPSTSSGNREGQIADGGQYTITVNRQIHNMNVFLHNMQYYTETVSRQYISQLYSTELSLYLVRDVYKLYYILIIHTKGTKYYKQ